MALRPAARAVGQRIKTIWEQCKAQDNRDYGFDAVVGTAEISGGHFSEIINGKVPPGVETLDKLAQALDVTMADLVCVGDTPREKLFEATRYLSGPAVQELLLIAEKQLAYLPPERV